MVDAKSLDEYKIIAAMLRDANASHGVVFNTKALRLTVEKLSSRVLHEGISFLTKTMNRLGKHLDQALAGNVRMTAVELGFKSLPNSKLPRFLGEFFITVFAEDGSLLPDPDAKSVGILRRLLLPFGKYKLPYDEDQEQKVIDDFKKAEEDLSELDAFFAFCNERVNDGTIDAAARVRSNHFLKSFKTVEGTVHKPIALIVRDARAALNKLFLHFDPLDIQPRHGPGVVATKQRHSDKFRWSNVSSNITSSYPFDAYFCASLGHVCDTYSTFYKVKSEDLPAQVLLVPKDSRGPRLISCEPVDYQWIQQGLGRSIVRLVESHPLTRGHVNFTDQEVNRQKALQGSINGQLSTLDLKEASDRIHTGLVRLLFPDGLTPYLMSCRSSSTRLPDGEVLKLRKYAPMGSALCFPILSLTCWALLYAGTDDADIRKNIFVYGDDVIVPTAYAASAMAQLELFGLKINRSKSCYDGFFRESCGMDAFKGSDVTPIRFKAVWSETPRPDTYESWISYANSFFDKGWMLTFETIRGMLESVFGPIPGDDLTLRELAPSLRYSTHTERSFRKRWNKNLQKFEFRFRCVRSASHIEDELDGWSKLLRFFSESPIRSSQPVILSGDIKVSDLPFAGSQNYLSVSQYTERRCSKLHWCWR